VPVNVIRRTAAPWVWDAVVADSTVALVESDSYGFPDLGQPQAQQQGTVKTLDLETGEVSTVSGGEISSPAGFSFWPWWFVAELPRAAGGAGAGPSVLWAVGNAEHGTDGIIRWQGLTGWTSSAGTKAVVGAETMTLPPIRTGDVLAVPLTSPAVPPTQYAALSCGDLPGKPPCVYDLRTGKLVDIAVKEPRTPDDWLASVVAGHWAAWVAI
jgi:hypothetical protein